MKRHTFYGIIILLAAGFLLTTCHKEYFDMDRLSDEIELNTVVVAPLIYGTLTMSDIMELFDTVEYIDTFPSGLIYISYSDTVISLQADTTIEFEDLETIEFYLDTDTDIPVMLPVPIGDTFFISTRFKAVDFVLAGDNRLDSILLQGGELVLNLTSSFRHTGTLTISSKEILDNRGSPFSEILDIEDASGNFETTQLVDLDRYLIDPIFRNDSNIVYLEFDLALINSGNPISPGEECVVRANFNDMGFYEIYGFLDPKDLSSTSGAVEIPLWNDNPELRSITFADPRIGITMASSVGIPFSIDFDSVTATGEDGTQVTLTMYEGNTLDFLAPRMDQIGETEISDIHIDNTNSNIQEFLAVAPSSISYSIQGRTDTTGGITTHFILDTSKVNLALEFLLPLDFKSTGFALSDTLEFEMAEDGIDTSMIDSVEVAITTTNELPIELALQVYMLNQDYVVIDQVFDGVVPILGASRVYEDGTLEEAKEEINRVKFPSSKLGKIGETSYLMVEAQLLTSKREDEPQEPFVKLYSHYTLKFNISIKAQLKINTREL